MALQGNSLAIALSADGFFPRGITWQGRAARVLYVERVRTFGRERRYLVRTTEGRYELGWYAETGVWKIRRSPTWFGRLWTRMQRVPRYPLPVRRRRVHPVAARRRPAPAGEREGRWSCEPACSGLTTIPTAN